MIRGKGNRRIDYRNGNQRIHLTGGWGMLTYGRKEDYEQLIMLWQQAFGDPKAFVQQAFDELIPSEGIYLWKEEGEILSALYAIPCRIRGNGEKTKGQGFYFYALATQKNRRHQGWMGRLMEAVLQELKRQGADFVFLQPAEENLFSYYEKRGFRDRLPKNPSIPQNLFFGPKQEAFIKEERDGEEEIDELPADVLFCWFTEPLIDELSGDFPI